MCCCCCRCSSSSGGRVGSWSVFCSISHCWMRGRPRAEREGSGPLWEGTRSKASGKQTAPSHLHMGNYMQLKKTQHNKSASGAFQAVVLKGIKQLGSQSQSRGWPDLWEDGIFHPRRAGSWGGEGGGKRAFLTVMALYVGGGWFGERSDRLLVAAGKKDVGGCLPGVPSHPGGSGMVAAARGLCLSRAGGRRGAHCWMDLAWIRSPRLINTAASAAAPSHSHTFPGALWGQKKKRKLLRSHSFIMDLLSPFSKHFRVPHW